jgi:predicted phage tail protein
LNSVTVHLHGAFREFHPGPITIFANTVAEAIESITRQLPGFAPRPKAGPHRLRVVGHESIERLYEPLTVDRLDIVPQLNGGKKGGFTQVLIGAALVAASFIPGLNAAVASFAFSLGGALLLGGLSQLLAPTPSSEEDTHRSRYLGAPKNTVKIGQTIPILYGRAQVFGHVLSFDVTGLNKAVDE